ncbi:MAG: hypothetical protein KGI52_01885 [Burkholderiales bacterium]|nr:hypothetical protein [Burkholderiales bacterium]
MTIKTTQLLGQYGINKDVQPQELPKNAWSDGANIRFRNGAMERMKGEQQVFASPSVTPYWLQAYYQGGKRYWVHAGLANVFVDDGTTRTDITPTSAPTGAVDNRWTGGVLNGTLVMNNGVNNPYFWGGTGVLTPLTAWPASTTAASLRPFKNFLVALDVTKSGARYAHMVKWSTPAVPGAIPDSWDQNDTTKLAGERDLAEEPSLMVDQMVLGDANIIYKENSMYSMRATGGLDVFSFQRLPGSVGAIGKGCIANTPKGHVVLTHGDVVIHQGQGPQSIINGVMRKWLFQTIDTTNRQRAFLVTNPPAKEVWVCFPELGSSACTKAAVWNWDDNTWTIRTLDNVTYGATGQLDSGVTKAWSAQNYAWQDAAFAWNEDELSAAQERLLICSTAPVISAADVTGTRNGAAYTSYAERVGLTFDDASRVKVVRGLRTRVDAAIGTQIQFEIGGSMNPETPMVWSTPVTYVAGTSAYNQIDAFATGRFIGVRVTSLDNQPFRFTSYDSDFIMAGAY